MTCEDHLKLYDPDAYKYVSRCGNFEELVRRGGCSCGFVECCCECPLEKWSNKITEKIPALKPFRVTKCSTPCEKAREE